MAEDSEGDRSQKTVAELLAQHGGASGGRRRRRSAEEPADTPAEESPSVSDTAPQAIIDRIHGEDTGETGSQGAEAAWPRQQSPNQDQVSPAQQGQRQQDRHAARQAPPQQSAPQQAAPQQAPPQQAPPQQAPAQQPRQPLRPRPVQQPSSEQQAHAQQAPGRTPPPPQQPSRPMRRPAPAPEADRAQPAPQQEDEARTGSADSLSARLDGAGTRSAPPEEEGSAKEASGESADTGQAPSAEQEHPGAARQRGRGFPKPANGWRSPLRPARRAEPEPNTDQLPVVSTGADSAAPDADGDVPASAPPAGLAKWRQRRKKEQTEDTEVNGIPPVPPAEPAGPDARTAPAEHEDGGPPTGAFTPSFDTGAQPALAPGGAPDEFDDLADDLADDYDDYDDLDEDGYTDEEFAEEDFAEEDFGEFDENELDDPELAEGDADAEEQETEQGQASSGRQWLVLAGQLTLGVLGGAGIWLGFNWLWGTMAPAALIAALVTTLVLVWVVRRMRRVEDLQTTVLTVLVGLVVTISPAALLLVNR